MPKLGIGLIGCGQIAARRYLPMLRRRSDVEVVAVCTTSPESARRAASTLGGSVTCTTDVEELIRHPRVEAVIISTPHRFHAQQAAVALEHGRHVLLEKPMATRWDDAERLIEAARRSRAIAMVLPYEHVGELRAMQSCLNPETVGRIVSVSADFSGPGAPPGRTWKYSLAESGGGIIVAHAVYALDLIASILGPARSVTAFANTLMAERLADDGTPVRSDIEDNAVLLLEFATGQLATVRSCWGYPRKQRNLLIQGTRACLVMARGGVYIAAPPGAGAAAANFADSVLFGDQRLARVPLPRATESILDHFLRCVRAGVEPEANIHQAAHVTEQMMKAYEAARTGVSQSLSTTFVPRFKPDGALLTG